MKMIKKKKDSDSPAPITSHKEHHPVTEDMLDEEDRKLKRLEVIYYTQMLQFIQFNRLS